jgi:hypothetical protein
MCSVLRLLSVAIMISVALPAAQAHHPGSHASREGGNRVRVEVVTLATDDCTRIDSIRLGMPATVQPPPGSTPITARLKRGQGTCVAGPIAVRAEQVIELPVAVQQIFLYIEGTDGALVGSQRVPVR